ncbi:MAG: DNA polymerase/3'-5' exonuclease PolX [Patescibacteria group bacterium]|jgi:DNA polymerase (family 10)
MAGDKFFSNQEIADLLRKVAAALEVKGENRFRIAAYAQAAVSIEHSTTEVKDFWDEGRLEEVPGIGKAIASYLNELFTTGKVKHFEEVIKALPPSMFVFEKIPGVGPKRALALAKNLDIIKEDKAVEKLKKAALAGKVREFEGFGEKSEQDLLEGIEAFEKGEIKENRMPIFQANAIAQEIIAYLRKHPKVVEATPLGSLRRKLGTVGDIDISVATGNPSEVMEYFFKYPKINRILGKGEEALARVVLTTGQQVDLRVSLPKRYGAMLQYFTGSKQHNIHLRNYALSKGLSLSEYGIKDLKNKKEEIKEFADEDGFYNFLGMEWIPPEIREGTAEIDAALKKNLPDLVETKDIKGDLHTHSDFPIEPSHDLGASSVEEMLQMAKNLGYEYLGFSEHNPSSSQHTEKEIIDILKRKQNYLEEINYSSESGVKIINGLEIDIKPSGELAIPDKGFDYLDYAIVSVHSSFDMNREKMTDRVLKGLAHPKAKILGHPTGRLIGSREGYELNWERIFDFCLKNNKFLEINAWPNRLDLPDFLIKEAIEAGVRLIINTDSHSVDQLPLMEWGVATARRGWAQKKDIVNALPFENLRDILNLS